MSPQRMVWSGLLALALVGGSADWASAQVFIAPAPVVSYYAPVAPVYAPPVVAAPVVAAPAVSYYTVPAPVVAAPAVSYYAPALPAPVPAVASVPAAVGYYTPVPVPYNVRVSRGLFGRTIVRTPFSTTKY